MKRLIPTVLCLALLIALAGCQQGAYPPVTDTAPSPSEETLPSMATEPEATEEILPETEPVSESTPEPEDDALVKVTDHIPQIRQELAYATVNNFSGQRIYDFTDAYLRYGTVKKLAKVCRELADLGMGLLIWDGFRPVSAQAALWDICPDPAYVSHPVTGNRSHCRGSAVDVTLVELETGDTLPLPTGFDNFTAYADRDYSDCSPEAAENALLLEQIMEKHGFKPYFAEWWHFTDTEEYPVDEYFDPALPSIWKANCQEFISLRETAGGSEVLAKIPVGEAFRLLQWEGKYAKVSYGGQEGYVLTSYIIPAEETYPEDALSTVLPAECYSYEQLLTDLDRLRAAYPELCELDSIGTSELGRQIPVLRIGSRDARYHVLAQGAIHGREHMTAWLLMAMADYWLERDILSYGDVCWHIIPMTNPDGVTVSQTRALNEDQQAIYQQDLQQEYTAVETNEYAAAWKANGLGVDINRNFDAGWEALDGREYPSSQQYPGEAPFSTAEARALRDYTLAYDFDATVSYHAHGSLIYWEYGEKEAVNRLSKSLAGAVSQVTGYPAEGSEGVDGAGYKDWVMDALQIPSVTVEVGCQDAPLPLRELYSIFARNYRVFPAIARWLQK